MKKQQTTRHPKKQEKKSLGKVLKVNGKNPQWQLLSKQKIMQDGKGALTYLKI